MKVDIKKEASIQSKLKKKHIMLLTNSIKTIFRKMAKDLKVKYISKQELLNMENYKSDFNFILKHRLKLVMNDFKNRYRISHSTKGIDEDIEDDFNEELLLLLSSNLNFITNTNEKLQTQILEKVLNDVSFDASPEIVANEISKEFLQRGINRSEIIATTTINKTAETTKELEITALILAGIVAVATTEKIWSTVLDGRERPAHHFASGQKKPKNEPFVVGGEMLNYPTDTSFGASTKNVVNCRCSAIYV